MAEFDGRSDEDDAAGRPRVTRGAGVFGVLALLGGFGGGFVAGYVAHDEPEPAVVEAVGADDGGVPETSEVTSETGSGPVTATIVASGMDGDTMHGAMPTPVRLFRRDTVDGLSVRVSRTENAHGDGCVPGQGWCPPPECVATGYLDAWVVGEWDVVQGAAPQWVLTADRQGRVLGTLSTWLPGDRMFGVFVGTGPDVTSARLRVGDRVDEMEPIDGLAVLAVPVTAYEITATYPPGTVVEVVAGGDTVALSIDDVFRIDPACTPPPPAPPALPPAGEQPSDVDAARADVEAAFRHVFSGDDVADISGVDDPTGLDELRDELRERYPDMLGGRVSYEIVDIVFTSPTSAAYYFRPVIEDYAELPRQIGGARLVDGSWLITRDTVCTMFRLGGVNC